MAIPFYLDEEEENRVDRFYRQPRAVCQHHYFQNNQQELYGMHHTNNVYNTTRRKMSSTTVETGLTTLPAGELHHEIIFQLMTPQIQSPEGTSALHDSLRTVTSTTTKTTTINYNRHTITEKVQIVGQGQISIGKQLRAIADSYEQQQNQSSRHHRSHTKEEVLDFGLVKQAADSNKLLFKVSMIAGLFGFTVGILCSTRK